MTGTEPRHECDLFLLSSHHPYFANRILSSFAELGKSNVDGWGIGYYVNSGARVLRSAEPAFQGMSTPGNLSREFAVAINAVSSPVILGHLRLTSRGASRVENNHPFKLSFLDYDWMLIHNGTALRFEDLVPEDQRLLTESNNDTARVFEFLRLRIIEYYLSNHKKSLIEACRFGYARLLRKDPDGKFNLILSNGFLSFVFVHWRPFYMLVREKDSGDAAIVSTLQLTEEEYVRIDPLPGKKAKLLVFNGSTLIFNGDIPK